MVDAKVECGKKRSALKKRKKTYNPTTTAGRDRCRWCRCRTLEVKDGGRADVGQLKVTVTA